jgi:hypothetical protein
MTRIYSYIYATLMIWELSVKSTLPTLLGVEKNITVNFCTGNLYGI